MSNRNPAAGAPLENVKLSLNVPPSLSGANRLLISGAQTTTCTGFCTPGQLLTLDVGTLLPGESREVQFPLQVSSTNPLPAFGSLSPLHVTGTFLGNPAEDSTASDASVIEASRQVSLALGAGPAPIAPLGTLDLTVVAGNTSTHAVDGLMTLTLPAGMTIVDAGGAVVSGNVAEWDLGLLPPGVGFAGEIRVRDTSGSQGRPMTAEARIIDVAKPRSSVLRGSAVASSRALAPMELSGTVTSGPFVPGDAFNLVITAVNRNPSGAILEDVVVQMVVPQHVTAINRLQITGVASSACTGFCTPGQLLTMNLGSLQPGESRQITVPTKVADTNPAPPLGSLLDIHLVGKAVFPNDENVQQVTAPVIEVIGTLATPGPAPTPEENLIADYYQNILGRAPDAGGLAFWLAEVARLRALGIRVDEGFRVIAGQFFNSPEYLSINTSNTQFVTDLYRTFFRRNPDQPGLDFWRGQLASGMHRDIVMFSFLFSQEFTQFMQGQFGLLSVRPEINLIVDFYRGLLGRMPDSDGFSFWRARFRQAQCQGANAINAEVNAISGFFAGSPESIGRNRTTPQFVADLYYAFLQRGGDLAGFNYWVGQLSSGAMNTDEARLLFLGSPEFQSRVNATIAAGCVQ